MHKKINILLMPTELCNMNCQYCFHECFHENKGRMTLETLDRIYEVTCNNIKSVQFVWHGGEPLLMGVDFFKYAIEKQKEYEHVHFRNTMQSKAKQCNTYDR